MTKYVPWPKNPSSSISMIVFILMNTQLLIM
jgi:hypothetical protein